MAFDNTIRTWLAVGLLCASTSLQAAIAVVAHPSTAEVGLTQDELARIYLGKSKSFGNGAPVSPVDQAYANPIRSEFEKKVLEMSKRKLKSYWSKRLFTGKGKPPQELANDKAVLDFVTETPGGIGYVDGNSVTDKVKLLLIIP